jgi:hypothetical protein
MPTALPPYGAINVKEELSKIIIINKQINNKTNIFFSKKNKIILRASPKGVAI